MMGVKVVHIVDPEYIFNSVFSNNFIKKIKILLYIGSEKRKKIELYVRLIFLGLHSTRLA